MNRSAMIFVTNDEVRAIKCNYHDAGSDLKDRSRVFKTKDASIEVDDLVVVPTSTRHNYTVVKVEEVDTDIDFDSNTDYNWIVQKVDIKEHEETIAVEKIVINHLRRGEVLRRRAQAGEDMGLSADELRNIALIGKSEVNDVADTMD